MLSSQFSNQKKSVISFLLFLTILVTSAGLRLYQIDAKSLWYDELHSIIPTNPENSVVEVIEYAKGDQPPLYFILLEGWYTILPYNEASGRTFSAIIGVLGVISVYWLGQTFYGVRLGLIAMFITGTNIFHIYYSQELRFYGLLFLLSTLSLISFYRFIRSPSIKNQCFLIISSVALLYTHYFGIVVALAESVLYLIIIFLYQKNRQHFFRGVVAAAIVLLAFSPWLPIVIKDNQTTTFWITNPGPWFFLEYLSRYFNGWWALSFKYLFTGLMSILLLHCLWIFLSDMRRKGLRDESNQGPLLLLGWIVLTLLIPYLYTIIRMPMLVDRYTLITLPAIILMIAAGYAGISRLYLRVGIMLVYLVLTVRVHHRYFHKYKKPEYRELSQQIIEENINSYPILSLEAWHFNYYFEKYNATTRVFNLHRLDDSVWLEDKSKFWIIFPEHLNHEQATRIDAKFEVERVLQLYNADAQLYRKRSDIVDKALQHDE
jgi:mannosyltransferase